MSIIFPFKATDAIINNFIFWLENKCKKEDFEKISPIREYVSLDGILLSKSPLYEKFIFENKGKISLFWVSLDSNTKVKIYNLWIDYYNKQDDEFFII